jgi:hypothetical protein
VHTQRAHKKPVARGSFKGVHVFGTVSSSILQHIAANALHHLHSFVETERFAIAAMQRKQIGENSEATRMWSRTDALLATGCLRTSPSVRKFRPQQNRRRYSRFRVPALRAIRQLGQSPLNCPLRSATITAVFALELARDHRRSAPSAKNFDSRSASSQDPHLADASWDRLEFGTRTARCDRNGVLILPIGTVTHLFLAMISVSILVSGLFAAMLTRYVLPRQKLQKLPVFLNTRHMDDFFCLARRLRR